MKTRWGQCDRPGCTEPAATNINGVSACVDCFEWALELAVKPAHERVRMIEERIEAAQAPKE